MVLLPSNINGKICFFIFFFVISNSPFHPFFNSHFRVFFFIEIAKLRKELESPFEVILFYFHIFYLIDLLWFDWCKFDGLWLFYSIGLWMRWLFYFIVVFYLFKLFMYKELLCIFFNTYGHLHPICLYNFWIGLLLFLMLVKFPREQNTPTSKWKPLNPRVEFLYPQKSIGGKTLWNFTNQILNCL